MRGGRLFEQIYVIMLANQFLLLQVLFGKGFGRSLGRPVALQGLCKTNNCRKLLLTLRW